MPFALSFFFFEVRSVTWIDRHCRAIARTVGDLGCIREARGGLGHKVLEFDAIPDLVEGVAIVLLICRQADPSKLRVLVVILRPELVKFLFERCADCGVGVQGMSMSETIASSNSTNFRSHNSV